MFFGVVEQLIKCFGGLKLESGSCLIDWLAVFIN